jgi:cupin 2 domain-containing protein
MRAPSTCLGRSSPDRAGLRQVAGGIWL